MLGEVLGVGKFEICALCRTRGSLIGGRAQHRPCSDIAPPIPSKATIQNKRLDVFIVIISYMKTLRSARFSSKEHEASSVLQVRISDNLLQVPPSINAPEHHDTTIDISTSD